MHANVVKGTKTDYVDALKAEIKQQPNRKILGTIKFHLWVYNLGSRGKTESYLRKTMRKIGEPPVLFDSTTLEFSQKNIKQYMFNMGHYDAQVKTSYEIRHKRAYVTYHVIPNQPYSIAAIRYDVNDRQLDTLVTNSLSKSHLKKGNIYSIEEINNERYRIALQLRNSGYYFFNKEYIFFEIDSNKSEKTIKIRVAIENPDDYSRHKCYTIQNVLLEVDNQNAFAERDTLYSEYRNVFFKLNGYRISRDIIIDRLFVEKNQKFNQRSLEATYSRLNELQIFKFISIKYQVDTTKAEPKLDCYIYLVPSKKYEFVIEPQALVTDQNNAVTSQRSTNFGLATNLQFRNRNILTKGEVFEANINYAIAVQAKKDTAFNIFRRSLSYQDVGISASLQIPRLILPIDFIRRLDTRNSKTTLNLNYLYEYFPEFSRWIASTVYGYHINVRNTSYFFAPIDLSYIRSKLQPEFQTLVDTSGILTRIQFLPKFIINTRFQFIYSNAAVTKSRTSTFLRLVPFETAGNLLALVARNSNMPFNSNTNAYEVFGVQFSQYFKTEFDLRFTTNYNARHATAVRLLSGVAIPYGNSSKVGLPFEKRYFIGGTNDLRAWRIRNIGPGAFDESKDFERAGDFKLLFNGEYRFNIYGSFKGAVFYDMGNVWTLKNDSLKSGAHFKAKSFFKESAIGTGLGLRYDFDFFLIRLDAALPVRDPRNTLSNNWVINQIFTQKRWIVDNTLLNLAIGYPF